MLSDALLAPQFAVGTLAIKGAEGFIVGYLGQKLPQGQAEMHQKTISVTLGILVAVAVVAVRITITETISNNLVLGIRWFSRHDW
jgi:uncharacterized membrane protein